MIEIIETGKNPQPKKKFKTIYYFSCYNCEAKFTCDKEDLRTEMILKIMDEVIFCPLCHERLLYSNDGFMKTVEVE
jgi:hypothetical protein